MVDDYTLLPSIHTKPKRFSTRRIVAAVALIGAVAAVIAVAVSRLDASNSSNVHSTSLAMSSDVENPVAGYLRQLVNWTADPCEDFYQYVCGNWLANFTLPADKTRYSLALTSLADVNQKILRGIVEDPAGPWPVLGPFYQSCMDEKAVDLDSLDPYFTLVNKLVAVQPVDVRELFTVLGLLHASGISSLFNPSVDTDSKDPYARLFSLSQGGLGLPSRDYYLSADNLRKPYQEHISKIFALYGSSQQDADSMAALVVNFETLVANISVSEEALRDPESVYHKMGLEQLEALTPGVSAEAWDAYLKALNIDLKETRTDVINVVTPSFFQALSSLIGSAEFSHSLTAYLHWNILNSHADLLSTSFRDEHFRFYGQVLAGQKEQTPRWKQCVAAADSLLGELLGRIYVMLEFPGASKDVASEMLTRIEKSFQNNIENVDWMDATTKDVAVTKVHMVSNQIGYPEKWKDYSQLSLKANQYVENTLTLRKNQIAYQMSRLHEKVDKKDFDMTPPTVNAYYNPTSNQMVFPAGILSGWIFNVSFPAAYNFGTTGVIMGHELSHGFDDEGRQFDGEGRLRPWWPEDVVDRFKERVGCVADFYSNYEPLPGLHVNGRLTLGENLADLGGVKTSFKAYNQFIADHGAEPQVMNEFTNEQLFFVSFGSMWCEKATPEAMRTQVLTNPHSPGHYRVNGPLSNFDAFASAFKCPVGSNMNPSKKCSVW
eukprot:GILJ01002525.1.p1 GENE.GILJ01002525.1~~GILJ01002525.1.p1  ORF type:complete len:717 (+),score=121.95 GILJ01002525.1:68-2218(+)